MNPRFLKAVWGRRARIATMTPNWEKRKTARPVAPSPKKSKDPSRGKSDSLLISAASVLMTVMFVARWARPDLLRPVGHFAGKLHEWTELCDAKLLRLMSYINCSLGDRMMGFVGDELSKLWLAGYADADFTGDRADSKSTGGGFLALVGEHSFYPLCAMCKQAGQHSELNARSGDRCA